MPDVINTIFSINDTSILDGTFFIDLTATVSAIITLQKEKDGWNDVSTIGPLTLSVDPGEHNFSELGGISYKLSEVGTYRWKVTLSVITSDPLSTTPNITSEASYTYFEVVLDTLPQPYLGIGDTSSGSYITASITNSYKDAVNYIFVKKTGGEYSDTADLILIGNTSGRINLGIGSYYAKVVSTYLNLNSLGKTDPVKFSISLPLEIETSETKNIQNVQFESITNPFFGSQFLTYFIKIPQTGYYQDKESKSLRSYFTDKINETIRGITLPEINTNMIALSYWGHQNDYKMGVGDGELGRISARFKLDRFLNNYTTFLNWQYLKYDWTYGGKNPTNGMKTQKDLEGIIIVDFLDSNEAITRQIGYKVIVDTVPSLTIGVDTPDEVEFEVGFRVTDIDLEKFIMGHPISDRQRIL
jgi:hypothetical protein